MNIKKISNIGVLTALAVLLMIILRFPYPLLPFLLYDFGDTPILIISFLFGPLPALISTAIGTVLMGIITGDGGPWGILMHFIATGTFVTTAGFIYRRHHNKKGAIRGLIIGSIAMAVIMVPANLLITPIYANTTVEGVLKMVLPIILPFNISKALLNALLTFLLYKRLGNFMRSAGLIKKKQNNMLDT